MKRAFFYKETIRDVNVQNKTVLVRVDYNVPLDENGRISDDLRIRASLPTLCYLLERGCKVVLISHLGRPNGTEKKYSLESIAERLSELLDKTVHFVDVCFGDKVSQVVKKTPRQDVVLLENLRFHPEEEADDWDFAKKIAKSTGAQLFVQDGFGVVHRAHASTHAITLCLPSVAGLLLEQEFLHLTSAIEMPKRPLIAVVGGAKVADKIAIIEKFIAVADKIIIGGAMANTFLAQKNIAMGASLYENNQNTVIEDIYQKVRAKVGDGVVSDFLLLPEDVAVAKKISVDEPRVEKDVTALESDDIALDIGDRFIEKMVKEVEESGTVIWNGTLGYATLPNFAHGSARLALTLALRQGQTTSIIGGGDTADFVLKWGEDDGQNFTHVSTGGGASLELLSGKQLPGIESLLDARSKR